MPRKSPNPIDVYVGGRVRMRRMLVGMSQEKLGESLGLTFQQVQKYEKGANRIGASRLYQIAHVLGVPVEFFYDGIQLEGQFESGGMAEGEPANFDLDMLSTSEGIQLNSAFFAIRDPKVRKRVLELVKALGETSEIDLDDDSDGDGLNGDGLNSGGPEVDHHESETANGA